jgi:Spy/CpxP family protein refolding chaperone
MKGETTMTKPTRIFALAAVLLATVAAAPALYADDSHGSHGSMMGRGMMRGHGTGMMNQMSRMMDHCSAMMQGNQRPNDQWRRNPPSGQDKND